MKNDSKENKQEKKYYLTYRSFTHSEYKPYSNSWRQINVVRTDEVPNE